MGRIAGFWLIVAMLVFMEGCGGPDSQAASPDLANRPVRVVTTATPEAQYAMTCLNASVLADAVVAMSSSFANPA